MRIAGLIMGACIGIAGCPAIAGPAAPISTTAPTALTGQSPTTAVKALIGKRVADAALARQRGGADTGTAIQGTVSENQAVNVTTGANLIGGGAFAGAGGVPVVVQNSGNNVLIQSSVVVNVQLK